MRGDDQRQRLAAAHGAATARGMPPRSTRLLAAAAALRDAHAFVPPTGEVVAWPDSVAALAATRAALGEEAWALSPEEAIAEALSEPGGWQDSSSSA